MSEPQHEGTTAAGWYFTCGEQQLGPVEFATLKERAASGELNPRGDMVWGPGMADWKRAGEVEGLFERVAKDAEPPPLAPLGGGKTGPPVDPYAAGLPPEADPFAGVLAGGYGGTTRGRYFLWTVVVPIVLPALVGFLMPFVKPAVGDVAVQWISLGTMVFVWVASLWATLGRFPNLAMSRWWFLGLFLPLLNLWLGYRLFACPPGYALHKEMDTAGKVLAVVYWGLLLLGLAALVLVLVLLGSAADSQLLEQLRERFAAAAGGAR